MDKLEALIKHLTDLKEELNKNVNCAPGYGQTNMSKEEAEKGDVVRPDRGYGKVIIKDTPPPPPNGKVIIKEEMEKDAANPALAPKEVKIKKLQAQIDAGTYKPDSKKIADKMIKEELTCSENGQWNLKIK